MSKVYIVINESHDSDRAFMDYSIEKVYETFESAKQYLEKLFEHYYDTNASIYNNFKLTTDYLMFDVAEVGYEKYYILETELFKNI